MEKSILKTLLESSDCYDETGDNELADSLSIRIKPNAQAKDIRDFWYKLLDLLCLDVYIKVHVSYSQVLQNERNSIPVVKTKIKIVYAGEFLMLAPIKLFDHENFFVKTVTDIQICDGSENFFKLIDIIGAEISSVPKEHVEARSSKKEKFGSKKMCEAENPFNSRVRIGLDFAPESLYEVQFKNLILPNRVKDII